eukprot:2550680-Pyramimonas_sp.AAC.1
MRGASSEGTGHVQSLSNEQVLNHWRVTPAFLELRVRRLEWLAQFVRYPARHAQILAAISAELEVGD